MINLLGSPEGRGFLLLLQNPLGVTGTPEEEMTVARTAGNAKWWGVGYDGQVHMHIHTCTDRGTHVGGCTHKQPALLFLPSCRRWWTRPRCCLCCLPPPPQTQSLQTWQTTGSYWKAEKGTESTLSEQVLVKRSTLPFLRKSVIGEDGLDLHSDWSSPVTCHACSHCASCDRISMWIHQTVPVREGYYFNILS